MEEIKVKNAELGDVQQSGHDLMDAISGKYETTQTTSCCILLSMTVIDHCQFPISFLAFVSEDEAQQVQDKMDSLRIRCSVLSLSSLDVLQRLEQALEASSRCSSSQEDLHLWLGRIERELLGVAAAQTHAGDTALCTAERQRVMESHSSILSVQHILLISELILAFVKGGNNWSYKVLNKSGTQLTHVNLFSYLYCLLKGISVT